MTDVTEATHPNRAAFPPGMSGPALRALQAAGVRSLEALTRWSARDLGALPNVAPPSRRGAARDARGRPWRQVAADQRGRSALARPVALTS